MKQVKIKDLKVGDFFTLSSKEVVSSSVVWIRSNFERSTRKYSCINYNDSCKERFLSGDKLVFVDFDF